MHRITLSLFMLLVATSATAQTLNYRQRQAVERQERNLSEAKRKLATFDAAFKTDMAAIQPDWVVPPAFYKKRIEKCTAILNRCRAMLDDLVSNRCPDASPRVRAIRSWVKATRSSLIARQKALQSEFEKAEKLANPKSYPELDADFARMEELAKAYENPRFST